MTSDSSTSTSLKSKSNERINYYRLLKCWTDDESSDDDNSIEKNPQCVARTAYHSLLLSRFSIATSTAVALHSCFIALFCSGTTEIP